jgi:hypothetical protein
MITFTFISLVDLFMKKFAVAIAALHPGDLCVDVWQVHADIAQ